MTPLKQCCEKCRYIYFGGKERHGKSCVDRECDCHTPLKQSGEKNMDKLREVLAIRATIKSVKKGWVSECKKKDYEDFKDLPKSPRAYRMWLNSRCQSCRAEEIVDFLTEHEAFLTREIADDALPPEELKELKQL